MAEQGVDLDTETKLAAWKGGMDAHVRGLTERVETQLRVRDGNVANAQAVAAVLDELRAFKTECRRDVDQLLGAHAELRAASVRVEGEVAALTAELKVVRHRCDEAHLEAHAHGGKHRECQRQIEACLEECDRIRGLVSTQRRTGGRHKAAASLAPSFASTPAKGGCQPVPSFEDLKRRWALRRVNDTSELDSLDLTLDTSRVIQRGVPGVNLLDPADDSSLLCD